MTSYVIERHDTQGLVKMAGDLTAGLVPELQAALKRLLADGATDLLFDLECTMMLDSSGMGLLIAAANSLARSGGHLRVINVSPDILRLLQAMRLAARLDASGSASKEKHHG